MKKYKEDYGRYTKFELPSIEECTFGDQERVYEDWKVKYPGKDVCQMWNDMEDFLKNEIKGAHQNKDIDIAILLREIIHWVEKRDMYSVALLLRLSWEDIEGLFTDERCTDETVDFVHYLRFSIE